MLIKKISIIGSEKMKFYYTWTTQIVFSILKKKVYLSLIHYLKDPSINTFHSIC